VNRPDPLRRLYAWVLHWAAHPHAGWALFLISFAEASFFPIPPDVLLIAMTLAQPKYALRFAGLAALGSLLGGAFGYVLGAYFWGSLSDVFFRWLGPIGFTPERFEQVRILYDEHAFLATFGAGFTPIPYKLFTVGAGVFGIRWDMFLLASTISRTARFLLVAGAVAWFGIRARDFLERYLGWLTAAFLVLLISGFALLRWLR